MKHFVAAAFVSLVATACVSIPAERVFAARMYNLTTGEVISGVSRTNRMGQSVLTAGPSKAGEMFSGEATSIDNRTSTTTRGGGTISNPGVLTDSYIRTSSYATSTPGYQNGSAILVGDKGTVIDILYRVSISGIGEGEGQDNKGNKYRLQFSQQN